ncbi:MAG: STAS domain-containing protein [Planctomycetota bacterium]|nr:MAG: STAS domain-containing protein [Planctomycetota bacterium]
MSEKPSPFKDALRYDVDRRDNVIVVKLAGSAHMENLTDLQDKLLKLVNDRPEQLIIDLSDLNFISSMGLGGIIAAHLKCRHHNGVVKLVAPQPAIMDLLEVTRLTKLFPIYDTVENAIADK